MYCRSCGTKMVENAKFCGNCGTSPFSADASNATQNSVEVIEVEAVEVQEVQTTQTGVQRIEITSVEQMESFLEGLQATASDSLASALSAQLQVIRYVNSPELTGTTIDTLLQNLKKAKEYAVTPREKDRVMEQGTLMMQNYVFFLKAKLVYAIEDNKEEGRRLFAQAGTQLTKCVTAVMLDTSGLDTDVVVCNNLFDDVEQNVGLFRGLLNWWNKEKDNQKKRQDFYKGLHSMIGKLHKGRDIVGQSNIIAGLIENHTEGLADFATEGLQEKYNKSLKTRKYWRIFSWLFFPFCLLIVWIVSLFEPYWDWDITFAVLIGIPVLIELHCRFKSWLIKRAIEKQRNEIRKYYNDIAASFEE